MALTQIEKRVMDAIDENAERIIELGKKVLDNPELGYREFETQKLSQEVFGSLGLKTKSGIAYTGVKAELGEGDCNVCLIGELDSV